MSETLLNGRFSVDNSGVIFWQADATNPLPGQDIGRIQKGASLLAPTALLQDDAQASAANDFLAIHTRQVLEPLFTLLQTEGDGALTGAAATIGQKLHDNLGVMHRSNLEAEIAELDADARKALRAKGVRMGPMLVFVPALIKPAAIRLRALLWGVWNDKTLPVTLPHDGRVSEVVDAENVDRIFLRMMGYPVFGRRAIRIDMLDRVVTDIYDTADKGVFEAKHKYAEWLGCGLDDLHAILESMGHRKMRDAVPDEAAATDVAVAEEAPAVEAVVEVVEVAAETAEQPVTEQPVQAEKPVLAVQRFFLKKGKMSERPGANKPAHRAPKRDEAAADNNKADSKTYKPRKAYDPNRPQQARDDKPRRPKGDKAPKRDRDEPRVFTFEGKKNDDDNNPFAILKQLQK